MQRGGIVFIRCLNSLQGEWSGHEYAQEEGNSEDWKGCGQQFANIVLWGDGQLAIYFNLLKEVNIYAESGLFNTKIVPNTI